MESTFIQLGKTGDVLSSLPIIHSRYVATGEKQNLIIAKEYASVVGGVDYVEPLIWEGGWHDFNGAYAFAKKKFRKVMPLSTYGKDITIQHRSPSWQHDQWLRSGIKEDWDSLKLVLPRPVNAEELVREYLGDKPCILLADESESSPFPHKDDLWKTLAFHFPECRVIRLSEIKLANIKDFLALFDAARCIVTIDTAFLHLSRATDTPVIALAYDGEARWRGSAWSSRFRFYVRYSEYESLKDEIVRAVSGTARVSKSTFVAPERHAYNPAMNGAITIYRHHPEKGKWRTELSLWDGRVSHPIQVPDELKAYSLEDPKLFEHDGKLWLSYVASVYPSNPARCAMGYGLLVKDAGGWHIDRHIQPKYGKNDFTSTEKNWSFFSANGRLYAIYSSEPQQVILELRDDRVLVEHKTTAPKWNYGEVRGGMVVSNRNGLLRVFHSVTGDRNKYFAFRYHIGALTMEPNPPFSLTAISSHPIIYGHEGWTPDCTHWKPNVVFPCTLSMQGDNWIMSYGENDCACKLATGSYEQLNLKPYVSTRKDSVPGPGIAVQNISPAPVGQRNKPTPRGAWVTR